MEVILVKQVRKLGNIGKIIKVKDGFFRNFLGPQKIAIRATSNNKESIEHQKADLEVKNVEHKNRALHIAKLLDGKDLLFIRQAADDGKLFGSVNTKEIAKNLSNLINDSILASQIVLDAPIKIIGVKSVEIDLHPEVICHTLISTARSESEARDAIRNHKTEIVNAAQESNLQEDNLSSPIA